MTVEQRSRQHHRHEIGGGGNGGGGGPAPLCGDDHHGVENKKWPPLRKRRKRQQYWMIGSNKTVLMMVIFFIVVTMLFNIYLSLLKSVLVIRSDDEQQLLSSSSSSGAEGHVRVSKERNDAPLPLLSSSSGPTKQCKCVHCNQSEDELCGGLWKGISYPPVQTDNNNGNNGNNLRQEKRRVHIVVSHCKADLNWMSDFIGNDHADDVVVASMHIITKCGEEVIGAPRTATIEELPNLGRCDHSYAKYITSILDGKLSTDDDDDDDDNNSIVMFLKDDMSSTNIHQKLKWNDFETMLRIASSTNGFACGLIYDRFANIKERGFHSSFDMSAYYLTEKLMEFSLRSYDRRKDMYQGDGVLFRSNYHDLGSFYRHVLKAVPSSKVIQACNGGAFATTVSNIKKVDASVWRAVERALQRGDSIEEGHFMERSWAYLLAAPLEQYQIDGLMQYSSDDRKVFDEVYFKSFKGALIHNVNKEVQGVQRFNLRNWRYCPEGDEQYMERYPDVKEVVHAGKVEKI